MLDVEEGFKRPAVKKDLPCHTVHLYWVGPGNRFVRFVEGDSRKPSVTICNKCLIVYRVTEAAVQLITNTVQISQGKTQNFHCISARFIKPIPIAEGGLRCSVPARPGWTTPHIWFLFVAPQFWNQASFRPHLAVTPLPYPSLRLCEHLAEDFHLFSSVPCLAHTVMALSGLRQQSAQTRGLAASASIYSQLLTPLAFRQAP